MLLRLCAALLIGSVQTALADVGADLNNQLGTYHQRLPKDCRIASAPLKLAYACSALETAGSNPRLYKVSETSGVNYCFNSLVHVAQNGGRLKITVLKDVGNQVRRYEFNVDEKNLKKDDSGDYALPLEGLEGRCFAYTDEYQRHCSKGFLGMGSTDIAMTVKLKKNPAGGFEHSETVKHNEIREARRNGSQLYRSIDFKKDEVDNLALNYARRQLVNHARQAISTVGVPHRPATAAALKLCDEAISAFENSLAQAPPLSREDREILETFRGRGGMKGTGEGRTDGVR